MLGLPYVRPDRSLKDRHVGKRLHPRRVAETSTGTSGAGICQVAIDRGAPSALATDYHRGSRPCPSVHPHVAGSRVTSDGGMPLAGTIAPTSRRTGISVNMYFQGTCSEL